MVKLADVEPLLKNKTWAAYVMTVDGANAYVRWRRCGFKDHTTALNAAKKEAMADEKPGVEFDDGVYW